MEQTPQSQLKLLVAKGKEQGYLTYAEVNDHLPEEMRDAEQIEGVISMITNMGIQVCDEAPDAEESARNSPLTADPATGAVLVDLADEVAQQVELRGNLCAADDGTHGTLRIAQRLVERLELGFHRPSGIGRQQVRQPLGGGMGAVRGREGVIDVQVAERGQLRRIGDLAATCGIRIAFEALAWGRFVDDYRRAWRIVQLADHPAVGVCLDSFHILSRGHDPAGIEDIPGEKIFYLQLADAPALQMDVLSWSRHHRLFPGEGAFDLTGFVRHVLAAGYDGPLSLEIFNDTFRQTDPQRTAVHALRSLRWLQDELHLIDIPDAKPPNGFDFVEIKAEDTGEVEVLLGQLGFTPRGRHRSKPVSLWCAGQARVVLNEQQARDQRPQVAAIGLQVPDAEATSGRARALMAPTAYRRTYASEQPFGATTVPGGVEVFWTSEPAWVGVSCRSAEIAESMKPRISRSKRSSRLIAASSPRSRRALCSFCTRSVVLVNRTR